MACTLTLAARMIDTMRQLSGLRIKRNTCNRLGNHNPTGKQDQEQDVPKPSQCVDVARVKLRLTPSCGNLFVEYSMYSGDELSTEFTQETGTSSLP